MRITWKPFSKNWRFPNRSNPESFSYRSGLCWSVKKRDPPFLKLPPCWVKRRLPVGSTVCSFKPETGKQMKKLNRFLFLLALIKFLLPFFLQNSNYEPHRDEFLYLAEGAHPAFGFMEVPPMLSVFAWFTQHLGNTMFWIKFWPSLIGALNLILIGKIVI